MKKIILLIALALLAGTDSVHSASILLDSFSYPDGAIVGAPGSPWQSHSGNSGTAVVSGGKLRIAGTTTPIPVTSEDVNATLPGGPYLSNSMSVLYASFKVKFESVPSAAGTYIAHFKDLNTGPQTGFGARVWTSTANAGAGKYRLGVGNGSDANNASGQIATDLDTGTTYIVVTKFVPNTGQATIWLNPSAETDPSVAATDVGVTRHNAIDVHAYAFRQAAGQGTNLVDDLKVGTTFADVAGPNDPPTITGVPNQNLAVGTSTAVLPFTVGDTETAANDLVVSASSSNQGLVPNANVVLGGGGASHNVQVTPLGGQQGTTTITLGVSDGQITATTTFQVAVGIPTISDIVNQSTPINTALSSISFTVGDTESAASSLTVTATSGNQTLLPDANITSPPGGASRTLSITPAADQTGLTTVTVTVSDGTSTASDTFILTVNPLLGLLRSDDFDRADGSLSSGNGQWVSNGGTGGTHGGELQISGNKIVVTEAGSEDVTTEMPVASGATYPTASGTILYCSMRVMFTSLPTAGGSYFAHLKPDAFDIQNFRWKVWAATTGAAPGQYRLGIVNNAASISADGLLAADLSLNTPYLIVGRYNVGTGESRLWINPSSESNPGINALDTPSPITIGAFTFRQNPGMGSVMVDDLKIGTAFSDVVQVGPPMTIVRSGTDVMITWPGGGTLQYADDLLSPPASINWVDLTGENSPYTTSTSAAAHRSFRVRVP